MQPDDELCLCFHVTKRKVTNYLRIEKPQAAAQLADCYGAGTGCGWCRPFLKSLFEASLQNRVATKGQAEKTVEESADPDAIDLPPTFIDYTATEYAARRSKYVSEGGGTPPPGATPTE